MKAESKLSRLLLVSPWPLLAFLVIPVLVILSVKTQLSLPLTGSTKPLLVNNACFALLVACRLLRYLAGVGKAIRYGAGHGRPREDAGLGLSPAEARRLLGNAGFTFAAGEAYGEKRDLGYLGTTIFYAGLFVLLSVGTWNNLRLFSATLLDGVGSATDLSRIESYRRVSKGLLSPMPATLPKLQIIKQYFPDDIYPRGATDVVLIAKDGNAQKQLLQPGVPVRYGEYDISMAKLVFEPELVIRTRDSVVLFDAFVKLNPLVQKRGVFSFYGAFEGADLVGGAYYQPEKSLLKIVVSRANKKVVGDMEFQVDQQVAQGEYLLSCAKMGQWSEIHVIRRRHMAPLFAGAVVALIGLALRVAFRPRRVWLEETADGCRVRATGREALDVLKGD